jgi:UDP-MurNAc hydroxylase
VRVTGVGHASLFVQTAAGSVLCDPWVRPAYFASWFPFPDNSRLDWDRLGKPDYLYVSHLHRDHFDTEWLSNRISKDVTVLLPDYPTGQLRDELEALGFRRFVETTSGEPVDLDGLEVTIFALTSPTDGPIGDSALLLYDGEHRVYNQNDARPSDLGGVAAHGHVDAHLLQFSGAIWYPMVYDLPDNAKRAFGSQKRARQFDRTIRYIDDLTATWVFPIAGPPCFLDDELWHLNDTRGDEANIFPDQRVFLDHMTELGRHNGRLLLPGSVADLAADDCPVAHPLSDDEVDRLFADKESYLRGYQERERERIELERRSWPAPETDLLSTLKEWFEPLLAQSDRIAAGVGGPLRIDLVGDGNGAGPSEKLVIDFPAREVRRWDGEKCRYWFSAPRPLVERLVADRVNDWVNSLFLSCRFSAGRIGQYNEYVYTFFKCLDEERLHYAEGWYAEQKPDAEDISLDGWVVQRRCPHLKADLSRFGHVEDGVLTCQMHGWKWDLASGRCLTSKGFELRSSPGGEATDGQPQAVEPASQPGS